jgi:hypothetical protein
VKSRKPKNRKSERSKSKPLWHLEGGASSILAERTNFFILGHFFWASKENSF